MANENGDFHHTRELIPFSPRVLFYTVTSESRMVRVVTRSVSHRLLSLRRSRQVFDNFNGEESPWVRLVALLDLSETCPLSASADSFKRIVLNRRFTHVENLYGCST